MSQPKPITRRSEIAQKVRSLRVNRGLTQAEFSKTIGLSQNRLSEIERGQGSFTAEQFLVILSTFNVPVSTFTSDQPPTEGSLQNALARLGAAHLVERVNLLPSERLEAVEDILCEVLVAAEIPRHLTALAPVLVQNLEQINLHRLWVRFKEFGLERRLGWLLENTLEALHRSPKKHLPRKQAGKVQRVEVFLEEYLSRVSKQVPDPLREDPEDVLGTPILSRKTLQEVRQASSSISQRWGIVSNLQVEDFLEALDALRLAH